MTKHGYYVDNRDGRIYCTNDVRPGWKIMLREEPTYTAVWLVGSAGFVEDIAVFWETKEELLAVIAGN